MFVRVLVCGCFVVAPCPALAQSTLDRVDPARAEKRIPTPDTTLDQDSLSVTEMAPSAPLQSGAVSVGAIQLSGLSEMSRADFADIIEKYIGRKLSASELAALTDALATRARTRYPFASARIDPQTMPGGVLTVSMNEGTIDRVRVEGVDNRAVEAALAPLADGTPVQLGALERRLLIAGDIDGIAIGNSRVVRENGSNVLVVKTYFQHVRAQVTLDNDSTRPLGPVELYGTLRINGVLAPDDSLQIFALDTVPQIDELAYSRLRYVKRISADGTELAVGASYSHSAPGAYLSRYDLDGESWFASFSALHPLLRRKRQSLWLEASIGYRAVDQHRADKLVRADRLTVARGTLYGYGTVLGGTMRVNSTVSRGLSLFDATRRGDVLASRSDADATFTSVNLFADWNHKIAGRVGVKLAVRSQLASQPLLISEQVGLGGASFIRGYDYSERSGDRGTMASGELSYAWDGRFGPARGAQLYVFADGGRVDNLRGGYGSGALYSSGGGIRADVDARSDAAFEVAVPLSGERYDTGNKNPNLRFSFTRHF